MRCHDWRGRLAAALAKAAARPFEWGVHDCCTGLAGPCVEAITGEDLVAAFRGRYDSAEGAAAVLKDAGFDGLAEFAVSRFDEIHPVYAQEGDLALVPGPAGVGFGVFIGERVVALAETGYGTVDRRHAIRAFRVA